MSEHEYPECIEDDIDRQDEPERPDDREQPEQEHCGLGICAAMGGHEGTCDEASGWAIDGEPERDELRGVVGGVLCNASNFPERIASRILGQDMGPLIDRTVAALIAAGYEKPETVYVCSPDGSSGHEMNAAALALIMANNTIERLTRELAESRREPEPREVTTVDDWIDPKPWLYRNGSRTAHKLPQMHVERRPRTRAQYEAEGLLVTPSTEETP